MEVAAPGASPCHRGCRRPTVAGDTGVKTMEISYECGPGGVALLGETIGANLERTVAGSPDAEALVSRHQGLRYTYAQLDEAIDVVARGLLDLGLEPGDRVGIWSPNYAEWVLVQYATAKIGVILVNINPAYRTSELEYALNQSGCRMLIAAPSFKTSDYVSMVDEVRPALGALEQAIFLWSPEWDDLQDRGTRVARGPAAGPRRAPRLRPAHQHPVHEWYDRLPEGRHAHAPQHPEQRLLRRRGLQLHEP